MKYLFLALLLMSNAEAVSNEQSIFGRVNSVAGCSKKAMVWLSLDKENYKERLLLMHTEVPIGGSFKFYVRSGEYQVRASDEAGCEFLQKVSVKGSDVELKIQMVKK